MNQSKNYTIISNHYKASSEGNVVEMFRNVSEDIIWREMDGFPCAGVYHSQKEIIDNVFSVLGRDWSNYRFELDQLHDAGEFIIGVGNYKGKNRKTNKEIDVRVTHIWKISEGKIIRFEQFTDTLLVNLASVAL
ncbi:MAG: nuclear transport factor 2 family protein [Bdellovibrionales bacterium]|nr:nuclear transport factor 2 family protein [Bdellovibrionales bacterium]